MEYSYELLLVGLGNTLHGDDGFGPRIIAELQKRYAFPQDVRLVDGGILGLSILPMIEEAREIIIIDTVVLQKEPGTLYQFPISALKIPDEAPLYLHEMGIAEVLHIVKSNGREVGGFVIGIEPENVSPWTLTLSDRIENKVEETVGLVIHELRQRSYQIVEAYAQNGGSSCMK